MGGAPSGINESLVLGGKGGSGSILLGIDLFTLIIQNEVPESMHL